MADEMVNLTDGDNNTDVVILEEVEEQIGKLKNSVGSAEPLSSATPPVYSQSVEKTEKVAKKKGFSFMELSKKRVSYCGIPSCSAKCDRLTFATSTALTYYGFKNRLAIVKICEGCKEKADQFEKKSIEAIRSGKSIFDVEIEPHRMMPKMVDLDDDDEGTADIATTVSGRNSELVAVDFDRGDVEGIVKNIMSKFSIQQVQMNLCAQKCANEINKLDEEMQELESMMKTTDLIIHKTYNQFNNAFNTRPKPIVIQEMEINSDGSIRRRNITDDKVFVNKETMKKLAEMAQQRTSTPIVKGTAEEMSDVPPAKQLESTLDEGDALNESIVSLPDLSSRKPGPASRTGYYEVLDAQRSGPFDTKVERPLELRTKEYTLMPTPKVIPRVRPKVYDIIYAMNKNLLHFWLKAEVVDMVHNETTNQTEFVVHYEPTKNGRPTGGVEGEGIDRLMRQLTLKQLAYNIPCPFALPVGSRVIAKFKDQLATDPESDDLYYAGIIAEPPKVAAKNRYLIFFDDGCTQYVHSQDVLLVCESSKNVWNDIYPDSYDFIKDYITRWPSWPMVKLHVGSIVATEWNGRWLHARIMEVDNCLARVRFENDSREEWIYRGSTRFRPVYRIIEKQEGLKRKQQENNSKENKIPRHDPEEFRNRNVHAIEYKGDNSASMLLYQKGARKSTGRCQFYDELQMFTSGGVSNNLINMLDPDICIEFQGSLTKIKVPADAPKPKDFVPHTCDSTCVIEYVPSKELKRLSPLAVPFFFGWEREVCRKAHHFIYYRSPCGVRLRDCDELAKYLDMTDSGLSVDQFCFEFNVDCLNEFLPARSLVNIKDISYGKEGAPVHCINSVDYDSLPYMEYTPKRILGRDVVMNTDEDFLVCCDCTDNCQDKSKCACWQLTQEGIAFTKLNDEIKPVVGYEHRRLKDHVVSGIYECNDRCKCKKTCSNRVVQNGVQWPLQIFKTAKKGWGIRAVYDMPEGTFICIYSGQILNDQAANHDGMEFGDEYLAELDYIECNEAVKEDYESDVTDIEDEDDNEDDTTEEKKEKRLKGLNDEGGEEDSDPERDGHADSADFINKGNAEGSQSRKFATRRTTGQKKKLDIDTLIFNNDDDMITARTTHFNPKVSASSKRHKRKRTRDLFGDDEQCYIMDAKSKGNIGRYLNHSCCPNVFVQNVFVDTHDMRFPLVAFFTNSHVKAGSELTWDYHYQIGSVPGKVLYCFCMTPHCRGRLL